MTSYSLSRGATRTTIVATWSGEECDQTANITTLSDAEHAKDLAVFLTRLSEAAWDAAAFLDSHPAVEDGIGRLIGKLRAQTEIITPVKLEAGNYRHTGGSFAEVQFLLDHDLDRALTPLTRTQRLTIADELTHDAAERAEALQLLPTGADPDDGSSRIWQMCEVTRSGKLGNLGPLPEGAAGWIERGWGWEYSPARRWGAREQLVRIEQLIAACEAIGGRAGADDEPLQAHLVVPRGHGVDDVEIVYVRSRRDGNHARYFNPYAYMVVTSVRAGGETALGEVAAVDDDTFARLLGEWTRAIPYLRSTDTYVDPATFE
ncbi:hypothetical protein ACFQZ4_46010 [Catellatospora coxensis]|uniref:Uncharacterized protein n=1 Tax=Catellatospora coxensis TaxID=310354 RepID=A0A8J3P6D9_9ACTN|nr:hypothetical protein [Catellatospora coxensis]GIG05671.1 hypothetical protein Cco03nite_23710 [Catellatospora coxensis]